MGKISRILFALALGGTVFAQAPIEEASPTKERARQLFIQAVEPLGRSLNATRSALLEAWQADGKRLSAAELELIADQVPLNFEQLAILDKSGQVLASLPADQQKLHTQGVENLASILDELATSGRMYLREDFQAEAGGRFHALTAIDRPAAEKNSGQAAFMYGYIAPFTLFKDGLDKAGIQSNERMYFFRENGDVVFASAAEFGGIADLRVRKSSHSLRSLFHQVLEQREGTGAYTGFGFASPELATHDIYWMTQTFMQDKWMIVYDQSLPFKPAESDGPLTGIWEVTNKKTPDTIAFLIHLIQEGPFCIMRAHSAHYSFTVEARYLNEQMASMRLAQTRYPGDGKLFNFSAEYAHEEDALHLNLYLKSPEIQIDHFICRRIRLNARPPKPEALDPLSVYSAGEIRETAALLLQNAEEDLKSVARFIQLNPRNATQTNLYERMLQRYPDDMSAVYLRRSDLDLQQFGASNLEAGPLALLFERSMAKMEIRNEPVILDLWDLPGHSRMLVLVPVWSDENRVTGLVGLLIPSTAFIGMLTEMLPEAFTGELLVLNRNGKVVHATRELKQQALLIKETISKISGQIDLMEYDAQLGRDVPLSCEWDTLASGDLNWKFIVLRDGQTAADTNMIGHNLSGRWEGSYQVYNEQGEQTDKAGAIECFVSQNGTELEILTSQNQVLHKFKGLVENQTVLAWTTSFIREDGRSEYLAAKIGADGTIKGIIYLEQGDALEEHWFKVLPTDQE